MEVVGGSCFGGFGRCWELFGMLLAVFREHVGRLLKEKHVRAQCKNDIKTYKTNKDI